MKVRQSIPLILAAVMLLSSLALMSPAPAGVDKGVSATPARANPLYQHSESYNLTFSKPTFFGSNDPYYTEDVEENDWDDIAIVVFFQDKHMHNKNVGSYNVKAAEIYQTAFIPLNGTTIDTGTNKCVLMEDFTAVWCGPCTAVIGSMDRLNHDENYFPDKYVGVEWHASSSSDVYYRAISSSRMGFYSGPAYPTVVIDGDDISVGAVGSGANSTTQDNNIKTRVNTQANTPSPISISAIGGHSSSQAWVNFTLKVEDSNFDNKLTEAHIILIQDAHPRRHNANKDARLGWIVEKHRNFDIFTSIPSNDPILSNILPADGSIISGDVEISFNATDPDADDSKIEKSVAVRKKGSADWSPITPTGGKYIWKTAEKAGSNYIFPDGEYEIRIHAKDYWGDEAEEIIDVTVRNPDPPLVNLDEYEMKQQLSGDMVLRGTFDIMWNMMDDEDDTGLITDIYYKSDSVIEWTPLVEGLVDQSEYSWNTMDPRVPDEEGYKIKVVVTDTDNMTAEVESSFRFEINNPDPPELLVTYPPEGRELSGPGSIKWVATDDEDAQQMLLVYISLSSDGGETWTEIGSEKPNSGTFSFDTTLYPDGDNYKGKVRVRDTEGLFTEAETPLFSIYNNDRPEVDLISPAQEDTVTGEVEITWSASDQEDPAEELTYDLYYMFESDTFWKTLTLDEPNTGSYLWDTTQLSEGDGIYTIRLVFKDTRGLESDTVTRYFTVYNPDEPVITNPSGPSGPVEKITTLQWTAYDPDPFETDSLKVWIYYKGEEGDWMAVDGALGIVNTNQFQLDVSNWADGNYQVKIVVSDCQEGEFNRTTEYVFPNIIVDNNDPPTIELISAPDPLANNTGDITFSWDGSDPEGKDVHYALYYRPAGTDGWIPITGALKLTTTSFIWNTSEMETGDYEVKIVATDTSREKLESEVITPAFSIYVPPEKVNENNNNNNNQNTEVTSSDDGSSTTTIIIAVIALGLVLVIAMLVAGLLIMKKKSASAAFPPPGGLPPGMTTPGMPPSQQQGLPGTVRGGQLPAREQQLPPPQTPQPPSGTAQEGQLSAQTPQSPPAAPPAP